MTTMKRKKKRVKAYAGTRKRLNPKDANLKKQVVGDNATAKEDSVDTVPFVNGDGGFFTYKAIQGWRPRGADHPTHWLIQWGEALPEDFGDLEEQWIPEADLCNTALQEGMQLLADYNKKQQASLVSTGREGTTEEEEEQIVEEDDFAPDLGCNDDDSRQEEVVPPGVTTEKEVVDEEQPVAHRLEKKTRPGPVAYDEDEQPLYTIKDYLDRKSSKGGKDVYLIHWEGFPKQDSTWEPLENLPPVAQAEVLKIDFDQLRKPNKSTGRIRNKKAPAASRTKARSKRSSPAVRARPTRKKSKYLPVTPTMCVDAPIVPSLGSTPGMVAGVRETLAEKVPASFASHFFPNRVLTVERVYFAGQIHMQEVFPAEANFNGMCHRLLAVKNSKASAAGFASGRAAFLSSKKTATAYYINVGEKESSTPAFDLQSVLSQFGALCNLAPSKVIARLQLFVSPAIYLDNGESISPGIFDELTSSGNFETIPEIAHEGCGFISPKDLERFSGETSEHVIAIQVRCFAPKLGIFKGMLCVKPGISKIQLPSSMEKVGPSEAVKVRDEACLLVKLTFPSLKNKELARVFQGHMFPPSHEQPKKLKTMMTTLFTSVGVEKQVVQKYVEESQHLAGLAHAYVVGLADPTGKIPPGSIFLTGAACGPAKGIIGSKVLVTRNPCTCSKDAVMLPLLQTKPARMLDSDWRFLCDLPFGGIIFGNPLPGHKPVPTLIADGDLDGDLYFVCWSRAIVSSVNIKLCGTSTVRGTPEKKVQVPPDEDWLVPAQESIGNVGLKFRRSKLVSELYKLWGKEGIPAVESELFGRAYKEALTIEKHGGTVKLPRCLWNQLTSHFSVFLSEAEAACPRSGLDGCECRSP